MKNIIKTENGPLPIGPYNQAIVANGMIFVSGQIAIDPVTNTLILNDIESETHRVLQNIKCILEAAGSSLDKVLKASVFVKDMGLFNRINMVYAQYFDEKNAPARELVQVSELPKYVNIEISVIALS